MENCSNNIVTTYVPSYLKCKNSEVFSGECDTTVSMRRSFVYRQLIIDEHNICIFYFR